MHWNGGMGSRADYSTPKGQVGCASSFYILLPVCHSKTEIEASKILIPVATKEETFKELSCVPNNGYRYESSTSRSQQKHPIKNRGHKNFLIICGIFFRLSRCTPCASFARPNCVPFFEFILHVKPALHLNFHVSSAELFGTKDYVTNLSTKGKIYLSQSCATLSFISSSTKEWFTWASTIRPLIGPPKHIKCQSCNRFKFSMNSDEGTISQSWAYVRYFIRSEYPPTILEISFQTWIQPLRASCDASEPLDRCEPFRLLVNSFYTILLINFLVMPTNSRIWWL